MVFDMVLELWYFVSPRSEIDNVGASNRGNTDLVVVMEGISTLEEDLKGRESEAVLTCKYPNPFEIVCGRYVALIML